MNGVDLRIEHQFYYIKQIAEQVTYEKLFLFPVSDIYIAATQ